MGIRIAAHPFGLDNNPAYHYLVTCTTNKSIFEWDRRKLLSLFKPPEVARVVTSGVVKEQRGDLDLKLTFAIPGTDPNLIIQCVFDEVMIFSELEAKLKTLVPRKSRLDRMKLKGYLAYLRDFHMIDIGNLPGSGLTYICADREAIDGDLDWIFQLSDRL